MLGCLSIFSTEYGISLLFPLLQLQVKEQYSLHWRRRRNFMFSSIDEGRDGRMNEEKRRENEWGEEAEWEKRKDQRRREKSDCLEQAYKILLQFFPEIRPTQSSSRSMSLSFALTSLDSIGREMFYWGNSSAWTREDTRTGRRGFLRSFTQHYYYSHWVLISLYPLPLLSLLDAFLSGICITRCFTRFVRKQQEMKVKIWKKTQVSVSSQLLSWVFFSLTSLIIHFHHHRSLSPEFTVILPFFYNFPPPRILRESHEISFSLS